MHPLATLIAMIVGAVIGYLYDEDKTVIEKLCLAVAGAIIGLMVLAAFARL